LIDDLVTIIVSGCLYAYSLSHFCLFLPLSAQVQSRRDAEIVRLKKQYLRKYLTESFVAIPLLQVVHRKRALETAEVEVATPRPKYRRVSLDMWKEACRTAKNVYDDALPSLEEAAQLFGYSN
jgi:CRP-like cAMP-binding protein